MTCVVVSTQGDPYLFAFSRTERNSPSPSPGSIPTVALHRLIRPVSQSVFNDLWSIDLPAGNCWRHIATTSDFPSPRIGHSAVAMGDRILIFGGRNFNTGESESLEKRVAIDSVVCLPDRRVDELRCGVEGVARESGRNTLPEVTTYVSGRFQTSFCKGPKHVD